MAWLPVRVEEEAFFDAPEPEPELEREIDIQPASQVVFQLSGSFETGEESTLDSWLNDYLRSQLYTDVYVSLYRLESNESVLPSGDELVECREQPDYGEVHASAQQGATLHFSDNDVVADEGFSFAFPSLASVEVGKHLISFDTDSPVGDVTNNPTFESHPVSPSVELLQPMSSLPHAISLEHYLSSESPPRIGSEEQLLISSPVSAMEPPLSPEYPVRYLVPRYPASNSDFRALNSEFYVSEEPQTITPTPNIPKNQDTFDLKLKERFGYFDLLYQERLYGMRAISNEDIIVPGRLSNAASITSSADLFMEEIRIARPRILSSLESDFELIYVAQTTLYWESLNHQYQQVKRLSSPYQAQNRRLLLHHVAGKFQEITILMERFVENEILRGLTCSDNIANRLRFHSSIQLPDVKEFTMEEHEFNRAEAIAPPLVLLAIKNCIEAFSAYIEKEKKKKSWKYKSGIQTTRPTVEDPLDLELLYSVMKAHQQNGIMVKHLQGKRRCWMRRKVEPMQTENEKINLMFAMIDMKLVERVLKMSLVSGSQLRWCLDKLTSLDFRQGTVSRTRTGHLFPCS